VRLRWKQVQNADDVIRAEAEKSEEENAPTGAKALVSDEEAVDETGLGSALRGRSRENAIG
jgi:hypothetical protein